MRSGEVRQLMQQNGSVLAQSIPTPPSPSGKISPAILFVIVVLAVLFFLSSMLHLLIRFLVKQPSSDSTEGYPQIPHADALQRQLQQLFHLHDSGLDQAFIDALPIFLYKELVGVKEPFDCAVCLSEFSEKDRLRWLPMCSHAFHIQCIDTWLLSNSSCPLCRGTLFASIPFENPVFDEEEDNREVVAVKLGKFKRLSNEEPDVGETSSSNLGARRCFSMGSYQYVVAQADLRVRLSSHVAGGEGGQRAVDAVNAVGKGESFSMSKIWLWPRKSRFAASEVPVPESPRGSLDAELPWRKQLGQ